MSTKKEYTIEELETQYKLAEEKQMLLKQQIEQKKQEEKNVREAKLEAEREDRKAEVDECIAHCKKLIEAYMKDYGAYSFRYVDDASIFGSKFWNWFW